MRCTAIQTNAVTVPCPHGVYSGIQSIVETPFEVELDGREQRPVNRGDLVVCATADGWSLADEVLSRHAVQSGAERVVLRRGGFTISYDPRSVYLANSDDARRLAGWQAANADRSAAMLLNGNKLDGVIAGAIEAEVHGQ